MLNPDKDIMRKENYITQKYRCEILTKVLSNQIQQYIKMIIYHAQVGFIPEMKSLFNIRKLMTVSHYINRLKRKMI